MGFAHGLLLRVAVILCGPAGAALAQEKLEGYCRTGLDPVDENVQSGVMFPGSICQHMPAGELVNCGTSSGGLSEGSLLARNSCADNSAVCAHSWVASSPSLDSAETVDWWMLRRDAHTLDGYGCTCRGHEYDPETQAYATVASACRRSARAATPTSPACGSSGASATSTGSSEVQTPSRNIEDY